MPLDGKQLLPKDRPRLLRQHEELQPIDDTSVSFWNGRTMQSLERIEFTYVTRSGVFAMDGFIGTIVGALCTTLVFLLRDAHRGHQDRKTLEAQAALDQRSQSLTPPSPTTDEGSFTRDQWDRVHSRVTALQDSVGTRAHIPSELVGDYESILDDVVSLGFSVDEFRLPQDRMERNHFMNQKPNTYLDRADFLSRSNAFIKYLEKKRPN